MNDKPKKPDGPLRPSPSLAREGPIERIERNFGPVLLCDVPRRSAFEFACFQREYHTLATPIERFARDGSLAHRAYPALAFACEQYAFENRALSESGPSPSDVKSLLDQIEANCMRLGQSISRLESYSARVRTPGKPEIEGHLSYLFELLCQSLTGELSGVLNESDGAFLARWGAVDRFKQNLASLSAYARHASDIADPHALTRPKSQSLPGLFRFVSRIAEIWPEMTGRPPSVHKTAKGDSDFVLFVAALAKIADPDNAMPSAKMIGTAFRNSRPPNLSGE